MSAGGTCLSDVSVNVALRVLPRRGRGRRAAELRERCQLRSCAAAAQRSITKLNARPPTAQRIELAVTYECTALLCLASATSSKDVDGTSCYTRDDYE